MGKKVKILPLYVKDLLNHLYEIQNKFNQDIIFDKKKILLS